MLPTRIRSSRKQFNEIRVDLQEAYEKADQAKKHRGRTSWDLIRCFWSLLRGHQLAIILSLVTLTIATLLALIPPASTKVIVDYVIGDKSLPEWTPAWIPRQSWPLLVALTLFVLLVNFTKSSFGLWGRWQSTRITKLLQMSVRRRVFQHAVRLPLKRVFELRSGGAASILRQDAGSVGDLVFGMLYNPWRAVIQLVGSLTILAWVDWRLLLGALAIIPIVYFTHRTWISRIRPQHRRVRAQREEVDGLATESFGGMRVVRAFGRERSETTRIMRGNHVMGRLELMAWWWTRSIEFVWETIIPIASACLMLYGGYRVLNNQLTLGDLMMFLVYLLMLLEPLAVLASSAAQFQNSLSGLDRVLDLLDEPRELETDRQTKRIEVEHVQGRITFEDVGFQYESSHQFALQDLTFEASPGEVVAFVGPSGAGKTTLCNLVARFYDPTSGVIRLDGTDIRDIELNSYRRLIGIVEQDVFLFDGSIAENICYGDLTASMEDIERAARIANAHDFICDLPQGYQSVIGERGVKLSGGQRQRLAIARAVLADPKILILDEATSNLDSESERLIQQSLEALMKNRTNFVIAHRLSTIRHANLIVVLEGGKIIETGSHDELVAKQGRYFAMVQLQTQTAILNMN